MEDSIDKKDERLKSYLGYLKWAIVFAIIWLIIGPIILTQFSIIDYTKSGQIGDTIGGIAAPVIGLISAILVYMSFQAQIRANEKMQDQLNHAHQQTNFEYLQKEFSRFAKNAENFKYTPGYTEHVGFYATTNILQRILTDSEKLAEIDNPSTEEGIDKLMILLYEMNLLCYEIIRINLIPEHRLILQRKMFAFYSRSFQGPIERFKEFDLPEIKSEKNMKKKIIALTQYSKVIQSTMAEFQRLITLNAKSDKFEYNLTNEV